MRIIFFSGYAISHLIPLKSTILFLKKHSFEIYIFGTEKNKWFADELKIKYIVYPNEYWKPVLTNEANKLDDVINRFHNDNNYTSMIYNILKKDAMLAFNHNEDVIELIKKEVNKISPQIVFRDSTDIYWDILKKDFSNIKTIGYITNNLYSWDYLYSHKKYFTYFLGIPDLIDKLPANYIDDFMNIITDIYNEIQKEFFTKSLKPYFQYDPSEDFNLIYSSHCLQPPECYDINKYAIVEPEQNEMMLENKIDTELITFIDDTEYIYISTGSFISRDIEFYRLIINSIVNIGNYKIVISAGKKSDELLHYINRYYNKEKIYIASHIPQKYILSNKCKLFITSGGINSIKEAIYYEVPVFVIPISCEQRLNGLILEELGIGYTSYGPNNRILNLPDNFKNIIASKEIQLKMKKISESMKLQDNIKTFRKLLDYITEDNND